jgi:hypothetical protein
LVISALSDNTIVVAIQTLIEADSDLYASTPTKIHRVFREPKTDAVLSVTRNYIEITPPLVGAVGLDEEFDLTGGPVNFARPFVIRAVFRQVTAENNQRIYDFVSNFRDAIKADENLSTTGVLKAEVTTWGYEINEADQTVVDTAVIGLNVRTQESF